jgi:hypothetical protein
MNEIHFILNISVNEYMAYYQGVAKAVYVTSLDGRSLQFPAHVLRSHITQEGIRGVFLLEYDDNNKFKGIKKVQELVKA